MDKVNLVRIATIDDKIQAEMLIGLLKEQNIYAYSQPIATVDYMNSYIGYGTAGEDVLVSKEDAVEAKKIADEFLRPGGEPIQRSGNSTMVRVIAILILVFGAACYLYDLLPQILSLFH